MEQTANKSPEQQSTDLFDLVAWAYANRKQLITVLGVILAVIVLVAGYRYYTENHEQEASYALSRIRPAASQAEVASPAYADSYAKIAVDYSGTKAAERALMMAAGLHFEAERYDAARSNFDKLLMQYSTSPLAPLAMVGIATCLEASGKTAEAATKYEEIIKRPGSDAQIAQCKASLARCYLALNRPADALNLYRDLTRGGRNDTFTSEAPIQIHEILEKYPELAKPATPATNALSVPSVTLPAATNK